MSSDTAVRDERRARTRPTDQYGTDRDFVFVSDLLDIFVAEKR